MPVEPMDTALKLEALLEHADWVRRLAHSLVVDPARADDVAQETWLAAMKSAPRGSQNLRGWLGTVVRNLARRSARGERRRTAREVDAAKAEALPSAAELVEQADLQREIAALVIGLDEPYRQTLLLRFYQSLGVEEIATRTGVPLNTVRTRLQRGLAQLREKLDRRFGERREWCVLLAPMLRAPLATTAVIQGSIVSSAGALIMAVKMKWLVLAAATLLGMWWLWPREVTPLASEELATASNAPTQPLSEPRPESAATTESARVTLSASPGPAPQASAPARVTTVITGRCVDLAGQPIAELELEWIDKREVRLVENTLFLGNNGLGNKSLELTPEVRARLTSDVEAALNYPELLHAARGVAEAVRGEKYIRPKVRTSVDGKFRIEQESEGGRVDVTRAALRIVSSVKVAEFPETLYVVADSIPLTGAVVDSEQHPIAGAAVGWSFSLPGSRTFPYVLVQGAGFDIGSTSSDEQGRFSMERVPAGANCSLSVEAEGFIAESVAVPENSAQPLTVVLRRATPTPDRYIAGRVIHRDGRAAEGARVGFGVDSAVAGPDGQFRLKMLEGLSEQRQIEGLARDVWKGLPLTAFMKGARPAVLDGVGAQWVANQFALENLLVVLESPLPPIRGHVLDASGKPCAKWHVSLLDAHAWGSSLQLEMVAGGDTSEQTTDAEGSFRLGGLLSHNYRVRACDTHAMLAIDSEPVPPGTEDLVLRVPADAWIERVAGRVVSKRGVAIGAASISIGLVVEETGDARMLTWHEAAIADAGGRFELRNVPRTGCLIGASDSQIRSNSIPFDASMEGQELRLEVELTLRFRVEPLKEGEFDRFEIADGSGKQMTFEAFTTRGTSLVDTVHIRDGSAPVCSTTEAGETLVLYLGEKEIRRVPLILRPGEITVVTP